jgi:hypothetical protein
LKTLILIVGLIFATLHQVSAQGPETLTIRATLNLDEDVEGYYEALEPSITLAGNSQICPSGNCKYELTDGVLNDFGDGMLVLTGILNIIKDTGEKIPVHLWGDLTMEGTLAGEIGLDANESEAVLEPDYLYKLTSGTFEFIEGGASLDIKAERTT